jgi:hypothetical protein
MVYVPSAEEYGFSLQLNEGVMREVLRGAEVQAELDAIRERTRAAVEARVRATASPEDAGNYVASMFSREGDSDAYGFDFGGGYALGNRPIGVVGVPSGRGVDATAKPPMMTEADHHALTSVPGFEVGGIAEDIR